MEQRLERLRELLDEAGCEAFLINQPANLRYFTGYSGDSAFLLLDRKKAYFLTDGRYTTQAAAEIPPAIEIVRIRAGADVGSFIKDTIPTPGLGIDENQLSVGSWFKLKEVLEREPRPAAAWLNRPRRLKEPEEIYRLRQAVSVAEKSLEEVLPLLRPGVREVEIAAELEFQMRRAGAERAAFSLIVASGERSALPHGVASGRCLNPGEIVTIDFGACCQGYHSDQTVTFFFGEPDQEKSRVYELLLRAQQAGIQALTQPLSARELDTRVREIIEEAGYGAAFSHGCGHGIGLEIHEGPSLSPQSPDGELLPGMVFTIEPGCYFPEKWGMRVEDMIHLTTAGPEKLTNLDKGLEKMVIT